MKSRFVHFFLVTLSALVLNLGQAQTFSYTKNGLELEVVALNPCDSLSSNGSIVFNLKKSVSGKAILVLITGPSTTIFPEYEMSLTENSSYTFIPAAPQSGTYDFVIRDPINSNDFINTLIPSIDGVDLKQLPPISIKESLLINNTNCLNLNGQLKIILEGGSKAPILKVPGSFSYSWTSDNQIGNLPLKGSWDGAGALDLAGLLNISGIPAGKYIIDISDNYSICSQNAEFTVLDASPVAFDVNQFNITSCIGSDVILELLNSESAIVDYEVLENNKPTAIIKSGVSGPLTFNISGSRLSQSGTYEYTILAKNGNCTPLIMNGKTTVVINPKLNVSSTITQPTCNGDKDGILVVSASGGSGQYTFSIDNGATFQQTGRFTNLSAGNYEITTKDSEGCLGIGNFNVAQPNALSFIPGTVQISCNGLKDGKITITASGGNGGYQYSLNNGITFQSSNQFLNLEKGVYDLKVKDSKNCFSSSDQATVIEPEILSLSVSKTDASTCDPGDGKIFTQATGGTIPFTYSIDDRNFQNTGNFTGLKGGNYKITVRDNKGCSQFTNTRIESPLINLATTVVPPSCDGDGKNGSIEVSILSKGNFKIGFSNNPPAPPTNFKEVTSGTFDYTNLTNGFYEITVKSDSLCPAVIPVTITSGPVLVNFKSETVEKVCAEDRSFIRLTNFTGRQSIGFTAEIRSQASIYKTQFIPALQAALRPVEIEIPDTGTYEIVILQDQSTVTPCKEPFKSPVVSFTMEAPEAILDITQIQKAISYPDLPTGSLSGSIIESQEEPYQTRLELITPIQPGQQFESDFEVLLRNEDNGAFQFKYSKLYAGEYLLTLKDAFGCVKLFPLTIDFDPKIFIPNIFTPDGDGINEEFFIRNLPPNSNLEITDSWGQRVFSSSNYRNDWKAQNIPNGIYYYSLIIGNKTYTGWVEVLNGK